MLGLCCGASEVGGGGFNHVSFNHDNGKQHALFGPILSERRLLLFLCCTSFFYCVNPYLCTPEEYIACEVCAQLVED